MRNTTVLTMALAATVWAADKKAPPTVGQSNESVAVTATLYNDPATVAKLLGRDPGFPVIVVEVKFAPRGENKIALWRDDFTLLSNKDGQRSQPLSPAQLAGQGAIVVSSRGYTPASGMGNQQGPVWPDGPVGTGRPRRVGQDDRMILDGTPGESKATVAKDDNKDNPLLAVLKDKVLPERETNEEVTGLLYFLLDGKHKNKDLELIYKSTPVGRLILDFEK